MNARAIVRTAYRIFNSARPAPISRGIPAELALDCRFCASRLDMLDRLPANAVVAELGTQTGAFAREIVARASPRELHLVDHDFSSFDPTGLAEPTVRRHQGDTCATLAQFQPEYFDWIYVDADHSYGGVARDIAAGAGKVKRGGLLVFNDFAHIDPYLGRYGVHRAVVDFVNEARWPLRFFAYQVAGLYDIAIERP